MRKSRFWVYYSLVMMVGFYPVGVFAGVRFKNLGWIDKADNESVRAACMDALSGFCDDDIDKSNICSNREALPEGCSSNYYGQLFALFEYDGDNSDPLTCNNATKVHLVYTCTGCNSSQMGLQGTLGLCEYGDKLTAGSSGKSIYDLMSTGFCHDVDTWSNGVELSVCVTCEILYDNTQWTTFNSTNHTEKRTVTIKNVCNNTTSTTTEYRCADGYTHVGGTANTSTMVCAVQTCSNCPTGANCNSSCDILSCKRGYFYASGEMCNPCDAGTYQPSDNNTEEDGASCSGCPEGTYSEAGSAECTPCAPGTYQDERAQTSCNPCTSGQYNPYEGATFCLNCPRHIDSGFNLGKSPVGATHITQCYQQNTIIFVDERGTYHFVEDGKNDYNNACHYDPT